MYSEQNTVHQHYRISEQLATINTIYIRNLYLSKNPSQTGEPSTIAQVADESPRLKNVCSNTNSN
jgi:hypothetical protein